MTSCPFPWDLFLALSRDLPAGRRSLRADSSLMVSRISPAPVVMCSEQVPTEGPILLAANHYQRRGLWIGWLGAIATAAVAGRRADEFPVRWLTTGGLQLFQPVGRGPVVPGTRWIFQRVAEIYGMTALPPGRAGARARARALRHWLELGERGHVLGIFPEGMSGSHTGMGPPQAGFPRLCQMLTDRAIPVLPLGCYEQDEVLHLRFGSRLPPRPDLSPSDQAERIMRSIAALLPPHVRGVYGSEQVRGRHGALE